MRSFERKNGKHQLGQVWGSPESWGVRARSPSFAQHPVTVETQLRRGRAPGQTLSTLNQDTQQISRCTKSNKTFLLLSEQNKNQS